MGIYSHGNKGHSHSHAGCFPFPILSSIPIPIGNLIPMVISSSHRPEECPASDPPKFKFKTGIFTYF